MSYTKEQAAQVAVPEALVDFHAALWGRWLDEHEYEDFKEYQKVMTEFLEKNYGAKLLKMTKRPFQIEFILQGVHKYLVCKSSGSSWGSRGFTEQRS